ncbi:MAG TPA: asparagine synthase (glutamine-hydrolyzing) [Steroidobacteraceae bacterium]|jgi:asparagine synthase (glutamine-hydrolysing)|nr:asparagine synthase (glutamine-hydrolyzing) [Steroidobacteraceae bacterium]
MCGIAGLVGQLSGPNRDALRRMHAAMLHRGPDAEGFWESPGDSEGRGVLLAHRRLSILDLSPAGAQPMLDPRSGNVIVFNGEIYNYRQLRDELHPAGESLHSTGDTAVILRMLSERGAAAIPRFRGMFALAFWDASRRELLLARDPLGIKPLYVARNPDPDAGWSLMFASELRALLASGLLRDRKLDPRAAASMIWNGFVVGPGTAVRGVESVWPGQHQLCDARGGVARSEFYWRVPDPPAKPDVHEPELADALGESVRLHLVSDVPVAVFLSAGIDSSTVANLAQRASESPVHTFTLAFEEEELNEGRVARRIAAAIGTTHREVMLSEGHFVDRLDAALESLDQPTFDGINSYYMSQAVRDAGFKVALVGTGGDELFGGYKSFADLPALRRWIGRTRWIPRGVASELASLALGLKRRPDGGVGPQTRWAKLPVMIESGGDLLRLYQLAYALFLPEFQRELLAAGVDPLQDGITPAMRARLDMELHPQQRGDLAAIGVLEQRLFLGERLLRDSDAASMASSVELRLPLVDHSLLETVGRMDEHERFHPIGRKQPLRRLGLQGLDPALFERPKTGFVLPFDRWIRARLGQVMDATMNDATAVRSAGLDPAAVGRLWRAFLGRSRGFYWSRVWAVYVLIRWCSRHRVTI